MNTRPPDYIAYRPRGWAGRHEVIVSERELHNLFRILRSTLDNNKELLKADKRPVPEHALREVKHWCDIAQNGHWEFLDGNTAAPAASTVELHFKIERALNEWNAEPDSEPSPDDRNGQ